jgi:hypothetical protein
MVQVQGYIIEFCLSIKDALVVLRQYSGRARPSCHCLAGGSLPFACATRNPLCGAGTDDELPCDSFIADLKKLQSVGTSYENSQQDSSP